MTIDPNQLLFGQKAKPKKKFTSPGAYGERIAMPDLQANKRPKPAPEQVSGPYYRTQTGLEIVDPGESAESTQARTIQAEKDALDKPTGPSGPGGPSGPAGPSGPSGPTTPATGSTGTSPTSTGGAAPGAANTGSVAAGAGNKVSAFDKLRQRLNARNLGSLYDAVLGLVQSDLPEDEFTLQLRATPAYQQRFQANQTRIANGLTPVSEAAYLDLEDRFQEVMRKRGLPESYWARSGFGEQKNFDALIANDVSADELDSRINAAQMVINANPQVMQSLRSYYPEIKDGDVLGYVLNPKAGLVDIERKVRGAQIGGAALTAGLAGPSATRLNELIAAGTSEAEAQRGFQSIANILPETKKLSEIYDSGGYTQAEAEAEAFGLAGGIESGRKRRRLASQERASFAGQAGISGTALERGRSGAF